jgi:hypothetical protein
MERMEKQTAVELLEEELKLNLKKVILEGNSKLIESLFEQAKEMEKQEQQKLGIILAIFAEEIGDKKFTELLIKAEQYYKETYGKDNIRV